VGVVLHQRGGERVLERLAVLEGDVRTASIASRFSVRLTGRPASRSSTMKPVEQVEQRLAGRRTSAGRSAVRPSGSTVAHDLSPPPWRGGRPLLERPAVGGELLDRLGDVGLVLEQDVDGAGLRSRSIWSTPSSTSVRAQSIVSDTDGAFFSSSWRIERTMRAIWSARFSVMPGTLVSTISFSRSMSG
jgi:hypothetical protein